ncbi:MAG: hypothetical protein QNJ71_01220 [Acidimicrobiia bacterium]|nr:hypothetical protein [Acidimicrobiia bacterium]
MTERGAVYDLGYAPYDGSRLGRRGARATLFADGIRRVLGIRRKARRKVFPWMLIVIAVVPSIVFVGINFFVPGGITEGASTNATHANFFVLNGAVALVFTALAAPELLIPDRRDGVLSILSSRPLTYVDYLSSRFASLVAVVGAFLIFPQFVLYLGLAATNTDGLFRGLVEGADALPKVLLVTVIYIIAYVPLGFVVASLANRKAIAATVYIAIVIGLSAVAEAVVANNVFAGGRWVALIAPVNTADAAAEWVFGQSSPESLLAAADINPGVGLVALIVFGAIGVAFSLYRYRSLM